MITAERASVIAHGEMPFHNPIGERAMDALVDLLPLGPADRVLDLGCGRGELLIRLARRTGVGGVGIDTNVELIAAAREQAGARAPGAELAFDAMSATTFEAARGSFALAACVGATHALGGLAETLRRLTELVRPSGYVVVGDGYWARPPEPAFLETLGATADELPDYPGLLGEAEQHGLRPVYVVTAGGRDWARYEWTYVFNADRYAHEHPDEEGVQLLRDRAEDVRRRRLLAATGGETLGFAIAVWRRAD